MRACRRTGRAASRTTSRSYVYQVAEVVRNLSLRNRDSGLSSGEKTMLMNARRVLVSELSFSLNTSEEAVEKKLDAVLA